MPTESPFLVGLIHCHQVLVRTLYGRSDPLTKLCTSESTRETAVQNHTEDNNQTFGHCSNSLKPSPLSSSLPASFTYTVSSTVSGTSTSMAAQTSSGKSHPSLGAIIGGAVAGMTAVAVAVVIASLAIVRRKGACSHDLTVTEADKSSYPSLTADGVPFEPAPVAVGTSSFSLGDIPNLWFNPCLTQGIVQAPINQRAGVVHRGNVRPSLLPPIRRVRLPDRRAASRAR